MKFFKRRFNILIYILISAFWVFMGCSNDYSKSAKLIEKGDYDNAENILQKILIKKPNDRTADSLFKKVSAIKMVKRALELVEQEKFEDAIIRIKSAEENDRKCKDLEDVKNKIVNSILKKAKQGIEERNYDEILNLIELVLPLGYRSSELLKFRARIFDVKYDNKITWEVVQAWNNAADANAADKECSEKVEQIKTIATTFFDAFRGYYSTILNPDFQSWRNYLDDGCIKETNEDVERAKEKYNETPFQTIKDYFILDLCVQPAEMGNTDGPSIVGIDILSPSEAWVHYTYPRMLIVEKIKVYKSGGRWKVSCKQESRMVKKDVYKEF